MQSPRSFRSLVVRVLSFSFPVALLVALNLPAMAQVTGSPDAPAASSSSSDVQTAQVVQKPRDFNRRDVAVSVFAQYTNKADGNFVRIDPTGSGGGMVSYQFSPRWWAGYEVNYGYTKYSNVYNKGAYRVDASANEITAGYIIKPRSYRGVHPFISFAGGAMIFSPSNYGGILVTSGTPATQTLPLFVLGIGVEHNFGEHFGFRVQYRDDMYKAPNFKLVPLNTHGLRNSNEPAVGVYYRF